MRCPHCESNNRVKKKPDLKTLRTLANGKTVKRERVCPRCEKRSDTVELFLVDYDQEKRAAADETRKYSDLNQQHVWELKEARLAAGVFVRLAESGGK